MITYDEQSTKPANTRTRNKKLALFVLFFAWLLSISCVFVRVRVREGMVPEFGVADVASNRGV
jgi:hypothetical protein